MAKWDFNAQIMEIPQIIKTLEKAISGYRMDPQIQAKTLLAAEESAVRLIEHSKKDARIRLTVRRALGDVTVSLSAAGEAFPFTMDTSAYSLDEDLSGSDTENFIRNVILNSYARNIRYKHKNGRNSVRILTTRSPRFFLYQTLTALALALLVGFIMRSTCPVSVNTWLTSTILTRFQTIVMNGMKMLVAPIVFLSIVGSITQFTNLKDVGRIGGKILFMYVMTSVIAVCVGIGLFLLIRPGDPSLAGHLPASLGVTAAKAAPISLLDTLVGIVPDNFLRPFVENEMLQLIFLAILVGIAVNAVGEKGKNVLALVDSLNEIFMYIMTLFVKLVPLLVFCSMLSTVLSTGADALLSVLSIAGTTLLGLFIMMVIYCILVAVLGHLNPLVLLRKYFGTMLQVFSLSSSNASISLNMDACGKKLGVSRKVYALSIPLGATINMDGLCVDFSVLALSLAHVFGIVPTGTQLFQVALTIIIISLGMPGIPGGLMVGMSMILPQLNVPLEAVTLMMGIYPLIDMSDTASNCLGDVASTVIVASSENLLDRKIYYSDKT
ncbi:MAG: dicarboxylate/amino acid:cation symporter [Clostridia bacterium]|nr:dicarboxylate/amino acid:cation symporter [Clostridia bacterium]